MRCSTRSAGSFAATSSGEGRTSRCPSPYPSSPSNGFAIARGRGDGGSAVMTQDKNQVSGEDSLIARYFKPLATDPGALGLVDDAAILQSLGEDIVVTTDAVVEGVHYLAGDPPDTIARKA